MSAAIKRTNKESRLPNNRNCVVISWVERKANQQIDKLTKASPNSYIENLILRIHKRNGGSLNSLNYDLELTHPTLGLDSMDMAEVVATIQRDYGVMLFEGNNNPKTWNEVIDIIVKNDM